MQFSERPERHLERSWAANGAAVARLGADLARFGAESAMINGADPFEDFIG
ncbi:MAG: hypothetical protein QXP27_06655 [Candidatus Methanomethyliaceae archaeon]